MDVVATAWEDHLQMLKETKANQAMIQWCRNCFEAGAESYLLPGVTTEECWEQFCAHVLFKVCRAHKMSRQSRDHVLAECKEAFQAGAEAQWMTTATTEELKALRERYVKKLRQMIQ